MRRLCTRAVTIVILAALVWMMTGCGNSGCTVTAGGSGRITGCGTSGSSGGDKGGGGTASNPQNMIYTLDAPVTGVTFESGSFSVPTGYTEATNPASGITGTAVNGKWVYSAGGQAGNVQLQPFAIDWSTGTLLAAGTPLSIPTPPIGSSFVLSHAIASDHLGRFLFVTGSIEENSVWQPVLVSYAIDQATGRLTQVAPPYLLPADAAKIAVDSSNTFLYLSDTDDGSVYVYVISQIGTLSAVSPLALGVQGLTTSPTAPLAYATDDTNHVLGFAIDTMTGNLTPLANSPFDTINIVKTDTIVIHPNGKFLYVSSFIDTAGLNTNIEGFTIADTGDLTEITDTPFNIPEDAIAVGNDGLTLFTGVGTLTVRAVGIDLVTGGLTTGPTTAMIPLTRVVVDKP